jgi:hypothetical protein
MNIQEVVAEISKFSFEEQLELIELVSRNLREERRKRPYTGARAGEMRGILKPDDGRIPNDDEVKEIITDYLMEKYS